MGARRSLGLAIAVGALLFAAGSADATVIDQASVVQRGPVVELRFRLHGSGLGWELSTHGNQLWIELDDTRLALPPRPLYGRETPPVELVRAVDRGGARSRLVIQVAGKADYAVGRLPHTLLVRVAPAGEVPDLATPVLVRAEPREGGSTPSGPALAAAPLAGAPPPPAPARGAESIAAHPPADADASVRMPPLSVTAAPAAAPANAVTAAGMQMTALRPPASTGRTDGATNQPLQDHPLVVIDPGHGGDDPGTEVGAPLIEKDLALQISLRLKNELEQRGVRAILTRTGDYFLTLHDRTAMADRERADLFISVHLNSSPDAATAGIETYYLNNTTDRATIRLAEMENAAGASNSYSASAQPDLNYILSDMRQQYKANESAALASMIESRAATDLAASFGFQVNGLGAKRGPFYVLVGAQMPAVLVECGFLSNREEAQRLASSRYQEVLAMGIAEAVANYFNADAAVGNL
jgi:N-acetylmuramoyl-L-alanine amidase